MHFYILSSDYIIVIWMVILLVLLILIVLIFIYINNNNNNNRSSSISREGITLVLIQAAATELTKAIYRMLLAYVRGIMHRLTL